MNTNLDNQAFDTEIRAQYPVKFDYFLTPDLSKKDPTVADFEQKMHATWLARELDEAQYNRVVVGFDEMLTDAIKYGKPADKPEGASENAATVRVTVAITESRLMVEILDSGPGYNPNELPDPTSPGALLESRGRGLYITRLAYDAIKYRQHPSTMILIRNIRVSIADDKPTPVEMLPDEN